MNKIWLIFALLASLLVGCGPQFNEVGRQKCPDVMPTPAPLPEFLRGVHPRDIIKKDDFDNTMEDMWNPESGSVGGVAFTVYIQGIYGNRDTKRSNKVSLIIDGESLSHEKVWVGDGLMPHGPLYYNWPIDLGYGYHNATLTFDLYTGETVTYSWSFCIVP